MHGVRRPCTAESNLAEFNGATNVYNVEQPDPAVSALPCARAMRR